jgi:hypothetical protein
VRVIADYVGNPWWTLRSRYEHGWKTGVATEEAKEELFRIGEQPGMRHYDVAARNRDRATFLGAITPASNWSFNAQVALGKDDYIQSEFGLRDNTHKVFGFGGDYLYSDAVSFTGSYTVERYRALSRSRQANPPTAQTPRVDPFDYETFLHLSAQTAPGVEVADASRNWATDGFDRAENFVFGANIGAMAGRLNLSLAYDWSRARATYDYITGPVPDRTLPEEVIVDTTLPPPQALPPTRSELSRSSLDIVYALTSRIGIGLTAWYEVYDVEDFTLDAEANPNQVRGSTVLLGYLYRPYHATTVWGRLLYRF